MANFIFGRHILDSLQLLLLARHRLGTAKLDVQRHAVTTQSVAVVMRTRETFIYKNIHWRDWRSI